jgi:hypothetical protein
MDVRGNPSFFVCESGGRSDSEFDARFRQGTLSETGLGWKFNDQLVFTFVRLEFKENFKAVTTIEFKGGIVL